MTLEIFEQSIPESDKIIYEKKDNKQDSLANYFGDGYFYYGTLDDWRSLYVG